MIPSEVLSLIWGGVCVTITALICVSILLYNHWPWRR